MKKLIICLIALFIVAASANLAFGRTIQEEKQAVRDYLNVVDAKLATAKEAKDTAKIDLLHAEKAATLARWYKLEATMVIPTPPPAPIVIRTPAPEPVMITVPNTEEAGRGVSLYLSGGFDAGLTGAAANLDYDLSGLPAEGLSIRIGANYVSGLNPRSSDNMQAASAKLGAVYYITPYLPDLGMPMTWYVGGAYLYPVKVNDARVGQYGLEAYLGTNYVIPEMGVVNLEVGYGALKYAEDQLALKGIDLKLGYGILF